MYGAVIVADRVSSPPVSPSQERPDLRPRQTGTRLLSGGARAVPTKTVIPSASAGNTGDNTYSTFNNRLIGGLIAGIVLSIGVCYLHKRRNDNARFRQTPESKNQVHNNRSSMSSAPTDDVIHNYGQEATPMDNVIHNHGQEETLMDNVVHNREQEAISMDNIVHNHRQEATSIPENGTNNDYLRDYIVLVVKQELQRQRNN